MLKGAKLVGIGTIQVLLFQDAKERLKHLRMLSGRDKKLEGADVDSFDSRTATEGSLW